MAVPANTEKARKASANAPAIQPRAPIFRRVCRIPVVVLFVPHYPFRLKRICEAGMRNCQLRSLSSRSFDGWPSVVMPRRVWMAVIAALEPEPKLPSISPL